MPWLRVVSVTVNVPPTATLVVPVSAETMRSAVPVPESLSASFTVPVFVVPRE